MNIPNDGRDITAMPDAEWAAFCLGYDTGLSHGYARGRQAEHDDVARIQRDAARIVHELAGAPVTDHEANARRAAQSAAYWSARRGEGGAA